MLSTSNQSQLDSPKREPQIPNLLSISSKLADEVFEKALKLRESLATILTPNLPTSKCDEPVNIKPISANAPLADGLVEHNQRLSAIGDILNDISLRLEI